MHALALRFLAGAAWSADVVAVEGVTEPDPPASWEAAAAAEDDEDDEVDAAAAAFEPAAMPVRIQTNRGLRATVSIIW